MTVIYLIIAQVLVAYTDEANLCTIIIIVHNGVDYYTLTVCNLYCERVSLKNY